MSIESHAHEHEFEPQYGLPERLPAGERILWQGSPDFGTLARRVFHLRKIGLYFALLVAAHGINLIASGSSLVQALLSLRWLLPLALIGAGSVALLAWLTARSTVYTLTNKRVVLRVGIVLTVTFNVPLSRVASAGLRSHADGFGDITLALGGSDRIAWLQLWPSVRPWRFTKPEPMLRSVPNAQQLSAQLTDAWTAAKAQQAPVDAAHPAAGAGAGAGAIAGASAHPNSVLGPEPGISQPHEQQWQASLA